MWACSGLLGVVCQLWHWQLERGELTLKEAADKFQIEVAKVNAAAKTGNLDNLKAAFGSAGSSCKACHDSFRKD